jgi:hypothetical protein
MVEITNLNVNEASSKSPIPKYGNGSDKPKTYGSADSTRLNQGEISFSGPPIVHSMFALDFAKFSELSLEQLPGSLSQLSNFIYGPLHNLDPSTNFRGNKFV